MPAIIPSVTNAPQERPASAVSLSGVQPLATTTNECVLICEGWPAWLFVFGSFPLACNTIYLKSFKSSWLSAVRTLYPQVDWLPLPRLFRLPPDTLAFLSDSLPWCLACYHRGLATSPCLLALDRSPTPPPLPSSDWRSVDIHHLKVGGILDGQWSFLMNPCWLARFTTSAPLPSNAFYPRRLRHVIETTDKVAVVRPCPPPPTDDFEYSQPTFVQPNILHWNGPLPLMAPLTRVCCRCAYSTSGWVCRRLTPVELGRAFDVPSHLLAWCGQWSSAHAGSLPFFRTAPPRTLSAIWATFQNGGGLLLRIHRRRRRLKLAWSNWTKSSCN